MYANPNSWHAVCSVEKRTRFERRALTKKTSKSSQAVIFCTWGVFNPKPDQQRTGEKQTNSSREAQIPATVSTIKSTHTTPYWSVSVDTAWVYFCWGMKGIQLSPLHCKACPLHLLIVCVYIFNTFSLKKRRKLQCIQYKKWIVHHKCSCSSKVPQVWPMLHNRQCDSIHNMIYLKILTYKTLKTVNVAELCIKYTTAELIHGEALYLVKYYNASKFMQQYWMPYTVVIVNIKHF